jgi:hypothetical protein
MRSASLAPFDCVTLQGLVVYIYFCGRTPEARSIEGDYRPTELEGWIPALSTGFAASPQPSTQA